MFTFHRALSRKIVFQCWSKLSIYRYTSIYILTKKVSQFLFLAVEEKKKIAHFSPEKIYSYLFITVQTLFSSIKPRFYYISILKLIYVYYSASLLANDLTIVHLSQCLALFFASLPVNVCLLWVNNRVLSLVNN